MKWHRTLFIAACLGVLTFNASATVHYVDLNCTNATPPYNDWSIAATNIQDAIDAAIAGDTVLVTNGIYATGGRKWFDSGTNRVTLTNALTLRSVHGPAVTLIVGTSIAGTGSALTNAARCVGIGNNAVLSGFTLTNGEAGTGNYPTGGGVANLLSISAATATVTNCVLTGNLATNSAGGGAFRVTLINCQIIGNHASQGGGACNCTLINCTVASNTASSGGGVFGGGSYGPSFLTNCTIVGNTASGGSGGGTYSSTLNNCVLQNNLAIDSGGGAYGGTAVNCLLNNNITGNLSTGGNSAGSGGGANSALLNNCILTRNSAGRGGGAAFSTGNDCILYYNYNPPGGSSSNYVTSTLNYCCTIPSPGGFGNITNEPVFVNLAGGDLHLASNSPCINAGNNSYITNTTDFDGNPRIVGGTVDIGAYEFQSPASIISYAWLQQYGLPTDGSADDLDSDGDGLNNWKEWRSGTIPTNVASVLQLSSPSNSVSGMKVTWQSVSGVTYYVQRSTNLPAFFPLQSNLIGQASSTIFTDVTATNGGPFFYRVGVQ